MRLGVISNLRSQQNLKHIGRTRAVMAARPEVPYAEPDGVDGLSAILQDFASRDVDHLVLNSGDGTVIATLTKIFDEEIFEQLPTLAVLPGGMTNMIAKDAGCRRRADRGLKALLEAEAAGTSLGEVIERPIMAMQLKPEAETLYGMFVGTAAIYRAILYTRKEIHSTGLEADGAAAVTLANFFLKRLFGRAKSDPMASGDHIRARFDDGESDEGEHLLSIVTTLEKLVLGSRPYWGDVGAGGLRYTRISYPAPRLLWNALKILYGIPNRRPRPKAAYLSRAARAIDLHMTAPFTMDGELFEPAPGHPVRLSCERSARFLRF